jgi:hypothetical protein
MGLGSSVRNVPGSKCQGFARSVPSSIPTAYAPFANPRLFPRATLAAVLGQN